MALDYVKDLHPSDIRWIKWHLKLAGIISKPKNVVTFVPAQHVKTYGKNEYLRTYSCGCAWEDYCESCQE